MAKRRSKKALSIYTSLLTIVIAAFIYFTGFAGNPPTGAVSTAAGITGSAEGTKGSAAISGKTGSADAEAGAAASPAGSDPAGNTPKDGSSLDKYSALVIKMPGKEMEGLKKNGFIQAKVTKVVDGDTVDVDYKGKNYKVRLLCIDTPESVKQGVAVQPYAKEASGVTKKELYGRDVTLIFDKGLRDRYGRLLAYVVTEDGVNINAMLVGEGYARVEIVSPNSTYEDYFFELQQGAISDKAGLWGLPADQQPFVKDKDGNYIPRYYNLEKAS